MNGRERLAALDQSMNLYKTARQHLDNDPSDRNVQRYVLAQAGLLSKLAEVAELDMAEAKERREPHAPVLVEPVVAPAPVLGMYTDADRAALQQARDAVQPAVDAAVVAAVAAIEAERDSAYAQRDAARAKALEDAARIAEVGAANQTEWNWSKLPGIIRALAADPASSETPVADRRHCDTCGELRWCLQDADNEIAWSCDECRVTAPAAKPEACATCHGCGEVQVGTGQPNGEGGEAWTLEPCGRCAGNGRAR